MPGPLVSVFVPTYNQAAWVEEAIRSALDQDYENVEVVVGDDGSTDGTRDVVGAMASRYGRTLRAFLDWEHAGVTANCNRLLRECRGEFVAFHAGDDVLLQGKLWRQVEWFRRSTARVLCGHDVEVFDARSGATLAYGHDWCAPAEGAGAEEWVRQGVIYLGQSIMVRRAALPARGYDNRLALSSDWKLWVDVLASGGEFGYIPDVLSRYRKSNKGITTARSAECLEDHLRACMVIAREHPHLARPARERLRALLRQDALSKLRCGRREEARGAFLRLLRASGSRPLAAFEAVRGVCRTTFGPRSLV